MGERKKHNEKTNSKSTGKGFLLTNVRAPEYRHRPVWITNIAELNCRLFRTLSKCWEIQVSNGGTLWVFPTIALDETILEIKAKIALPFWSSFTTSFVLTARLTNREICQNSAALSRRSSAVTVKKCTKSVIHVQSCCFANSGVCVAVAVAVAVA